VRLTGGSGGMPLLILLWVLAILRERATHSLHADCSLTRCAIRAQFAPNTNHPIHMSNSSESWGFTPFLTRRPRESGNPVITARSVITGSRLAVRLFLVLSHLQTFIHPIPFLCAAVAALLIFLLPVPMKGRAERREARILKSRLRGAIVHAYEARRAPDPGPAALASRRSNLALRGSRGLGLQGVRASYLSPATATGQNLARSAHPVVTSGRRTPGLPGAAEPLAEGATPAPP
jgi:hypothetical protein